MLVDCWTALHASEKDYSYYISVHEVYTHIDLLLTDHTSLDLLIDSTIEQITISDHVPVILLLALLSKSWRLNENLFDDIKVVA